MRRALVLAMVTALVASGCGDDETKEKTGATTPSSAPGERVTVLVDGKASNYNGVFTAFFPAEVKVHPGATVDFKMPHFPGDPHTVTLGTLVDAGVKKLEALGPTASFADQENTAQLTSLPDVFAHEGLQGADLNQSAALPCYLDSGVPPLSLTGGAPPCPERDQPEFNGRQSFYNSGALARDNVSFPVKLSADIAPGTYGFFCLIHRGGMYGKLTVVDKATSVPSASEVANKADAEFKQLAARLEPAAKVPAGQPGGTVLAGALAPDVFNAAVAQFMPANVTIAAGQAVTWQWFYAHTVSFNVPPEAKQFFMPAADGTLDPNPKVFAPANSPALPAAYQAFPPSPLGGKANKPFLLDGGRFDGTGYKNSGFVVSMPFLPAIVSYKVTFTKPGTYSYVCILHPAMGGVGHGRSSRRRVRPSRVKSAREAEIAAHRGEEDEKDLPAAQAAAGEAVEDVVDAQPAEGPQGEGDTTSPMGRASTPSHIAPLGANSVRGRQAKWGLRELGLEPGGSCASRELA